MISGNTGLASLPVETDSTADEFEVDLLTRAQFQEIDNCPGLNVGRIIPSIQQPQLDEFGTTSCTEDAVFTESISNRVLNKITSLFIAGILIGVAKHVQGLSSSAVVKG